MKTLIPIPPSAQVLADPRILYVPTTGQYRLVLNSLQLLPPWGVTWTKESFAPVATSLNTPELLADFFTPCKGSVPQTFYLRNGGKVGIGFNLHDNAGDIDLQILTSYQSAPSGQWTDQIFNVMKLQSMLFFNITITEGYDDLIYVLMVQDASDATPLIRFRPTAAGLELVDIHTKVEAAGFVNYNYIPKSIGDPLARQGELPPMQLLQDSFRKTLLATYPNNYGPAPGQVQSGTRGSLTRINADVSKELVSVFDPSIWQYTPPLFAFPNQDFYGVAGFRWKPDSTRTWLLLKVDLGGNVIEETEKTYWNEKSAWSEDGYVFYGDAEGYWVERLYDSTTPPEPGPGPDPIPEPLPPLIVSVFTNRPVYRRKQTAIITVNVKDTPDARVSLSVVFRKETVEFSNLSSDADGNVVVPVKISPSYGVGLSTAIAIASKPDHDPGTGRKSFTVTA